MKTSFVECSAIASIEDDPNPWLGSRLCQKGDRRGFSRSAMRTPLTRPSNIVGTLALKRRRLRNRSRQEGCGKRKGWDSQRNWNVRAWANTPTLRS